MFKDVGPRFERGIDGYSIVSECPDDQRKLTTNLYMAMGHLRDSEK